MGIAGKQIHRSPVAIEGAGFSGQPCRGFLLSWWTLKELEALIDRPTSGQIANGSCPTSPPPPTVFG